MSEGSAGTPPVRGIVLGHGTMAEGLVDAVRQITGAGEDAIAAISNRGLSPEALSALLGSRLDDAPAIVFTDLPSGSCGQAAMRLCRTHADLVVISGVNLPLLLDFVSHRDLPLAELIPRLLSKGRTGICCVPESWEPNADRPVPGR